MRCYMDKYISAIITAAGSSQRMNKKIPKQFLKIKDKMILEMTLDVFQSIDEIREFILVIREEDEEFVRNFIKDKNYRDIVIAIGGDTREKSTYNGLNKVNENCDLIISHDAARPFIRREKILEAIESIGDYDGLVVSVGAKDTIKYVDDDMKVVNTPNRSHLYMAQTPQVFKYKSIKDAYKLVFDEKINVTDDSSLLEIVGKKVKIIKGDYSNIKITTQEDLLFGELIARKRENE